MAMTIASLKQGFDEDPGDPLEKPDQPSLDLIHNYREIKR
jgi:hypothetical protein